MTEANSSDTPSDVLYVTDDELIRKLNVPRRIARPIIQELDRKSPGSGFPQKQKLWGDRRYWPDVKAYFDAINRGRMGTSQRRDG